MLSCGDVDRFDGDGNVALLPYGNAFPCGCMGGRRVRRYDDGTDAASGKRAKIDRFLEKPDPMAWRRLYYTVAFDGGAAGVGMVWHVAGDAEGTAGEPASVVDAEDLPARHGRIYRRDGCCGGGFHGAGAVRV